VGAHSRNLEDGWVVWANASPQDNVNRTTPTALLNLIERMDSLFNVIRH